SKKLFSIKKELDVLAKEKGGFLRLQLMDESKQVVSENVYWLADGTGKYSGLSAMNKAKLKVSVKPLKAGKVEVTLSNPANNPVAFFNRVSVIDKKTGERVLPVFYSDNYFSVVPGGEKKIEIEYNASSKSRQVITVAGWNVELQRILIDK
ncbi:MAG: Mannosylglycoprotein endo-beta-mannosidase, partial [Bacteroidetes bacterium]|nr:Mannosylglycoprotein endo-beta-mannosidase [Bacteroidota bacterium]